MVEINIVYQGGLHCKAVHQPSAMNIETDAPKDNMGKGESFSPTDLVATALGSCMLTVMGITANKIGVNMDGTTLNVTKEMVTAPVRMIGKLTVIINFPTNFSDEHKQKLEQAALTCPVHKSLHPDIITPITFNYGE
jgi:putative redox protein